jgi:hypothetical protein
LRRCFFLPAIAASLLPVCSRQSRPSDYYWIEQISFGSRAQARVRYLPFAKSGADYFYDNELEYRVWLNPANGAEPLNGKSDYFVAFAQYETANEFSKKAPSAEAPLVLVRQLE